MPETTQQIIGLEKDLIDPGTGAAVRFHVVRQYSVSLHGAGSSSVTLASYVTREAFDAGRNPLMHVTAQLDTLPTGDSAQFPHWFAERLLSTASAHDLSGATPVYAEAATPDEELTA